MGTSSVETKTLPRTVVNPIIRDKATFLETSRETGGRYTLVEVELAEGGGNGLHIHTDYAETFMPVEGQLSIEVDGKKLRLQPGDQATAEIGAVHRFFNETGGPIRFRVRLTPGHEGFENSVRIAYGLAVDGLCNAKAVPKNLYHLAVIVVMGGHKMTGALKLIQPLFGWLARRARRRGIERQLMERYCQE
jgi:quercetin dioxygenase-like cupin family protein